MATIVATTTYTPASEAERLELAKRVGELDTETRSKASIEADGTVTVVFTLDVPFKS